MQHRLHSIVLCAFAMLVGCAVPGVDSDPDDLSDEERARGREEPMLDSEALSATPPPLASGQAKVLNQCWDLRLYQYNPYPSFGTTNNPYQTVTKGKKLIWQTYSGTPNGWATVLSAGQEYWGWRFARAECLGGTW